MIRSHRNGQASLESVLQLVMAPLDHAVTLWMKCSGGDMVDSQLVADVLQQGGGKLAALVFVRWAGMLNLLTLPVKNALAQVTTSNQQLARSTKVRR